MTENTLGSSWNLNLSDLLKNITKERLVYLAVFVVLVGAIIYYLKYVRNSEKLLNTQNFNNELLQQLQQQQLQPQQHQIPQHQIPQHQMPQHQIPQQQMPQQQMPQQQLQQQQLQQQQQQVEYPKKIVMDIELVEELKAKKMTPQDYIFELQKTGQFPHGPMPEIVIDYSRNMQNNSQQEEVKLNNKKESNLNDLKIDEDEEENETSDKEDDNLRNEDLSKEEMDNIKEQLLRLQKPVNK